jgi:Protein of unknown function (DUF3631)
VNSGWTRGQGVVRCDPDTNEPRKFSTFCPKAIASKGKEAPDTILSRAIIITQKRRTKAERVDHFSHIDDAGFARLRSQLARWAADNGAILGSTLPAMPEAFLNRLASNWQLMFAIADRLGEGKRAREVAQQIAGVTDLISAGVELLADIKTMFDCSTLDYLTSKAILQGLTADPEKRWAEWSRGKPITEKGVASLLHEYGIFSRDVGSEDRRVKGYRTADFADAWERLLPEKENTPSVSNILPRSRAETCNDSTFAEKSAAQETIAAREKFGGFNSNINALSGCAGKNPEIAPSPEFSADLDNDGGLPACLRRCAHCNKNGALGEVALPDRPGTVWLHRGCEGDYLAAHNPISEQESRL